MPKVSQATVIVLGLVGPKVRLKGVADGQQVNIPVQRAFRQSKTGWRCYTVFPLRWRNRYALPEGGANSGVTRKVNESVLRIHVQAFSLCSGR